MTLVALVFGCVCVFASGCFCGAATWHWWVTRPLRAERRRQERDAHDARAFRGMDPRPNSREQIRHRLMTQGKDFRG